MAASLTVPIADAIAEAEDMASRTVRALVLFGVTCALTVVAGAGSYLGGSGWNAWLVTLVAGTALFLLVAFMFVIRWFVRVYRAAEVARRVEPHSGAYLFWVWLIPVVSLFRPKELVNDVWRATDAPGAPSSLPRYLQVWWVVWLLPNAAPGAGASWGVFVFVALVLNAWLTIRVVRRLTARLAALQQPAAPAPAPGTF
jgi:hypothetical protein